MPDLTSFYIYLPFMVAGFSGGILHSFIADKDRPADKYRPWDTIRYVVAGGLAANFFTPPLLKVLPQFAGLLPPLVAAIVMAPDTGGMIAFVLGLCGFQLCHRIDSCAGSWNPFERTKNE